MSDTALRQDALNIYHSPAMECGCCDQFVNSITYIVQPTISVQYGIHLNDIDQYKAPSS